MHFPRPNRRNKTESIVPMINVVFLLLIFFLMTAEIAPQSPPLTLPESDASERYRGDNRLYLMADGQISFADAWNDQAWLALADTDGKEQLMLHVDRDLSAQQLARTMTRLGLYGWTHIDLVTTPR